MLRVCNTWAVLMCETFVLSLKAGFLFSDEILSRTARTTWPVSRNEADYSRRDTHGRFPILKGRTSYPTSSFGDIMARKMKLIEHNLCLLEQRFYCQASFEMSCLENNVDRRETAMGTCRRVLHCEKSWPDFLARFPCIQGQKLTKS